MTAPRDGGLRAMFRAHIPSVLWTAVETGLSSPGVPDAHGAVAPRGGFWVEFKRTTGWTVPLEAEQVGWLLSHVRRGVRAYVAVRRTSPGGPRSPAADDLFLLWGGQAAVLRAYGLRAVVGGHPPAPHALLGHWAGGEAGWNWGEVEAVLCRGWTVEGLRETFHAYPV